MARCENPPYYITAYGLAVKRGFKGTLDEWLESLKGEQGKKGDRVELRYLDDKIQWRWVPPEDTGDVEGEFISSDPMDEEEKVSEPEEQWYDLVSLSDVRGEMIEQTLETAQQAAEAANTAQAFAEQAADDAQRAQQAAEQSQEQTAAFEQRTADALDEVLVAQQMVVQDRGLTAQYASEAKAARDEAAEIAGNIGGGGGDLGGSGIHVGTEEPEDEAIDIWVNPDGEPVNLMEAPKQAKVGQTIVVSAVDENGAPIAWEAADLPAVEAEAPSGTSEWKYAGKFTTTEHVNPFTITEDENGNPLSFKELFLRVNLHWFHHSDNFSANRGIDLLGGDGNWYGVSLNVVSALKLTKAATLDEITVLPTDVTPLRIVKIGDYVYASMALIDQYNNALSECCGSLGCRGIHCPGVTMFTGLRFSMGHSTNLVVAGSNVEVYYK